MDQSIENKYKEHFKTLLNLAQSDEDIKEQIFDSINRIDHLSEIFSLFTDKFVQSELELTISLSEKKSKS